MGLGPETASGAIRVSIGPTTTEAEALAFADFWTKLRRRFAARAA
jgi:cysteine desulfurase